MAYKVFVVDMDGDPFTGSGPDGELANARVTRLSQELNGPGAADISLPTTDPDAALLIPGREVQILYEGVTDPLFWGPIVRPQAGLDETTWQCQGLLWYFGRRFMGRADRVDQLTNGDFESSETGWSFSGVTHSVNTDPDYIIEGTKSEKLTGGAADHTTYAYQIFSHGGVTIPPWPGDYMNGSAYVYVPAGPVYSGPAFQDRGLALVHKDAGGAVVGFAFAVINDDTPKDEFVHLETGVPNVKGGETVEVRLYPPHGEAFYDLVTLTFMESLSFGTYGGAGADVTTILEGIVEYAQDPAAGKSDLNIGTDGDPTGTLLHVAYQFAEHRNILDAILEYVRQGTCDISIELTPTTRTFTVWPDRKGTLYATTLELDVNLATFTWSQDLEQAASSVVLLGPGDGPDRPEGGATDTSFAGGAFTAEIVEQVADDTTIGQLDVRAAERLAVAARPEILEVTTLPGAGVIGDLAVGDTVPVVISHGWVTIDATYRVSTIAVNLDTDQATITMNALP